MIDLRGSFHRFKGFTYGGMVHINKSVSSLGFLRTQFLFWFVCLLACCSVVRVQKNNVPTSPPPPLFFCFLTCMSSMDTCNDVCLTIV